MNFINRKLKKVIKLTILQYLVLFVLDYFFEDIYKIIINLLVISNTLIYRNAIKGITKYDIILRNSTITNYFRNSGITHICIYGILQLLYMVYDFMIYFITVHIILIIVQFRYEIITIFRLIKCTGQSSILAYLCFYLMVHIMGLVIINEIENHKFNYLE